MRTAFGPVLASLFLFAPVAIAQQRVGVYDSRVVAYAHFWSVDAQREHANMRMRAEAAKAAGDRAQFDRIRSFIRSDSKRAHLEVFSTAPAAEAMSALEARLPAIRDEAGVDRLVSRWDAKSLDQVPQTNRVDVTDRLVRELLPLPTDKQKKTIAAMKNAKPIPLWEARVISFFGLL